MQGVQEVATSKRGILKVLHVSAPTEVEGVVLHEGYWYKNQRGFRYLSEGPQAKIIMISTQPIYGRY